jgi:hypothetical protein
MWLAVCASRNHSSLSVSQENVGLTTLNCYSSWRFTRSQSIIFPRNSCTQGVHKAFTFLSFFAFPSSCNLQLTHFIDFESVRSRLAPPCFQALANTPNANLVTLCHTKIQTGSPGGPGPFTRSRRYKCSRHKCSRHDDCLILDSIWVRQPPREYEFFPLCRTRL